MRKKAGNRLLTRAIDTTGGRGTDGAPGPPGRAWKLTARQRQYFGAYSALRGAATRGFESDLCGPVRAERRSSGAVSGLVITSITSGDCCVRWAGRPSVQPSVLWSGMRRASSVGSNGTGRGLKNPAAERMAGFHRRKRAAPAAGGASHLEPVRTNPGAPPGWGSDTAANRFSN
jgi:hypothetical protein